jgi:hypothetical protein
MGETVTDRNLTQLVLNRLPRSFESTIQTLTHQIVPLSFEQVASSLTTEGHQRENRSIQLGDEQALAASFQRASLLQSGIFGQYHGRGEGGRGYFRGRFLGRMIPRAPLICYNCGAAGHIARNYQQQPKVGYPIQNDHGPIHANSAEFFDAACRALIHRAKMTSC